MIHPQTIFSHKPPCIQQRGLHKRLGVWACAEGLLDPIIYMDHMAEMQQGFEALMFHEALHVVERHALIGFLLVWVPILWVWWRREQEIRADVCALEGAGGPEFYSFVHMHPHPTGFFWRWCYGQTPRHRLTRTHKRWEKERRKWARDD